MKAKSGLTTFRNRLATYRRASEQSRSKASLLKWQIHHNARAEALLLVEAMVERYLLPENRP